MSYFRRRRYYRRLHEVTTSTIFPGSITDLIGCKYALQPMPDYRAKRSFNLDENDRA